MYVRGLCLSVYLSIDLSIYRSIYTSIYLSTHPSISIDLSIYPSIYLSNYLSVCLSVCLSLSLSIDLPGRLANALRAFGALEGLGHLLSTANEGREAAQGVTSEPQSSCARPVAPTPYPPAPLVPPSIPTRVHLRLQQLAWKALPHLLQAAVAPNSGSLHLPHDAAGAASGALVWQAVGSSTGADGWPQDI
jgi:hypothetical protein